MNVRAALAEGSGALETGRPGSPFLDAVILLGLALNREKDRILASMPDEVDPVALDTYRALVARRLSGESVAYIAGYKEFYGRRFSIDCRVLVPRPDTELLVETILTMLPPARPSGSAPIRYHDAFSGSGCVGITVAAERPDLEVSLSDASAGALELCDDNARAILGRPLDARLGDILSAAAFPLDMISANPPYVSRSLTDEIFADGSREPRMALDGGELGLDLYPRIATQAFALLGSDGVLALEIGDEQGPAVKGMLESAGFHDVSIHRDLSGHDRVVSGGKRAVRR